jgi:hypothetical protein
VRQARHKALADRIDHIPEHDRDGACLLLENPRRRRARGKNDIGLGRNDLLCKALKRIHIRSTPAVVDMEVAALDPAKLLQTLMEYRDPALDLGIILRVRDQRGNATGAFLRAPETRQRQCCAAKQRDEFAALHSITSSARSRIEDGSVMPSSDCKVLSHRFGSMARTLTTMTKRGPMRAGAIHKGGVCGFRHSACDLITLLEGRQTRGGIGFHSRLVL